ncbi:MAG TPA: hypothetical protein PKB10_06230 [Tepidisphaeraceae bacterium]|nr:hypothetical protein [Tepidisphaeraceae bacterium]
MKYLRRVGQSLLLTTLLLSIGGCAIFGALASKLPEPKTDAAYKGLAGQSVALMVWADDGVRIDWPLLSLDTANALQLKLTEAANAKEKTVEGISFPNRNDSMLRWQRENPGWAAVPITETALRFRGITRLIVIEYENFGTRSSASMELFRGAATVTLRVVEIQNGQAKIAFEENGIQAFFPRKSREEGVLGGSDQAMYAGVVDLITAEIAKRFVPHYADD